MLNGVEIQKNGAWQSKVYGMSRATPTVRRRRKTRKPFEIKRIELKQIRRTRSQQMNKARKSREIENGGSFSDFEWCELVRKFNNMCPCCLRSDVKLGPDHIIPIYFGGSSNIENIQPLCKSCNSSKGIKIIEYQPYLLKVESETLFSGV